MFLTAIVAMDRKGLIGANGKIPWHLPSDLRRFRRLTMGKPVIMGRKTWESLPGPLEGRTNIVVTRNVRFEEPGAVKAQNPHEAVEIAAGESPDISVIGGAEIYAALMHLTGKILVTVVDGDFEGDTRFPFGLMNGRTWLQRGRKTERHPEDSHDSWCVDIDFIR